MFGKNQNKEEDEAYERQEEFMESQDQNINLDQQYNKPLQYASQIVPEDYFQYKKFSNLPEAQAEFPGLVDKDVVFANLKPKDRAEQSFKVETINLCQNIFVKEQDVMGVDNHGKPVVFKDVQRFDEDFRPIVEYLLVGFKYDIVSSRAEGDTRAAMLDITSFNNINKSITKKKADNNDSRWGFGKG